MNLGGGSKGKNHEGFMHASPTKSQRERSQNRHKKFAKKSLRKSLKGEIGKTHPTLKEPHRIIYTYQRGSYKV
jgi:hypothetical protein